MENKEEKYIIIKRDGNEWCAHWSDFVNVQESICAFGSTPQNALQVFWLYVMDKEENDGK
jgi:hypothetical protein